MKKQYKTFSAARAGSGGVNLATGELEFVHEDVRVGMSSVSHVYVGGNAGQVTKYGKGFTLNVSQGDGVDVVYDSSNKITEVYVNDVKELDFGYTGDRLRTITDSKNRITQFEYANDRLTGITYPNGDRSIFAYQGDKLCEMIPPSGIGMQLSYTGDKIAAIAQKTTTAQISSNGVTSGTPTTESLFTISYETDKTTVTVSQTNAREVYYFTDTDRRFYARQSYIEDDFKGVLLHSEFTDYELTVFSKNNINIMEIENNSTYYKTLNNVKRGSAFQGCNWVHSMWTSRDSFNPSTGIKAERSLVVYEGSDDKVEIDTAKTLQYHNGRLVEERIDVRKFVNGTMGGSTQPLKRYAVEYDSYGRPYRKAYYTGLFYTPASTTMVYETIYDSNGNADKIKIYHQSNPQEAVVIDSPDNPNITVENDDDTGELLSISATPNGLRNKTSYLHKAAYLTQMTSTNTNVKYNYDKWGRTESVMLNNTPHVTFEYLTDAAIAQYINGDQFKTIPDNLGRVLKMQRKYKQSNVFTDIITSTYRNDRLAETFDYMAQEKTKYTYDWRGNVSKVQQGDVIIMPSSPNANTQVTTYQFGGKTHTYTENYIADELQSITLPTGDTLEMEKDMFGRVTKITSPLITEQYYYQTTPDKMDYMTQQIGNGHANEIRYNYDNNGNITMENILAADHYTEYEYDEVDRLTRFTRTYVGSHTDITEYDYDSNGNIKTKKLNGNTIDSYTYNGDRLMSYNGQTCTYDNLGNPTTYRNKALQWDFHNLMKYDNISFTYDATGLRRSKNNAGVITKYTWAGDRLLAEKRIMPTNDLYLPFYPSEDTYLNATSQEIEYIYGYNGVIGFKLDNVQYWYLKNIFGDVLQIIDEYTNIVAEYEYDAWGSCTIKADTDNIATLNPIRYRSYYYDTETGLYYLKSRYYDPQTGRFISMDSIDVLNTTATAINGLNLYAYCLNNPVMYTDSAGKYPVSTLPDGNLKFANFVKRGSYTRSLIKDPILAALIGNITDTVSMQDEESGLFYVYSDIGNGYWGYGAGVNIGNIIGFEVGVTAGSFWDLGVNGSWSFGPISFGNSLGTSGIGASVGVTFGNTTRTIGGTVGWGTIAVAAALALSPIPGARFVAGIIAFFDWLF